MNKIIYKNDHNYENIKTFLPFDDFDELSKSPRNF